MCGIAGIVNFTQEPLDTSIVRQMVEVLSHRGPDGDGVFTDKHVVIGHARLSIIDVLGSSQPLSNEDGSVWVTFNGEIYNYRQIRRELILAGHHLRTKGDTEVLVHLYEQYGQGMVEHLQGMFAFAIWDKRKKLLLAARDRMGIKPFYYCQKGDNFIFASEPKAILQHPAVTARVSEAGLWHYLTYRAVPAPNTLYDGILKLKPGHILVLSKGQYRCKCYWDIPLQRSDLVSKRHNYKPENLVEKVESSLFKSVQRRLISDVPLGAFLSGGVDSSLIVAMMSMLTSSPVKTYSVGFDNFGSSELPYAKVVAKKFKTDHHQLVLGEDCFADHLEKLIWLRDQPLSEPADIPLHMLAKMASEDVKVLLSGEGADELFAGYPKYAYDHLASVVGLLPKKAVLAVADALPGRFRRAEVALRSLCKRNPANRWAQWFAPFTEEQKTQLLPHGDSFGNPTMQYVHEDEGYSRFDLMLYADCKLWLPENLLDRGDRMTMGASVECRVPFLDHELVELAFSIPKKFKVKMFTGKWLIKQIANKYLPKDIVYRKKVGFAVPLAQWFRGRLKDFCYDKICENGALTRQIASHDVLRSILDDHCRGRKDNSQKIWTLLGLAIWSDIIGRKDYAQKIGAFRKQKTCT